MRRTWGLLTLLLVVAVPVVCHATVAWDTGYWGVQRQFASTYGDAFTIDPTNGTATNDGLTMWSTVGQQSTRWGRDAYAVDGLGIHFTYDTNNLVTAMDWIVVTGYNGDAISGNQSLRENTAKMRFMPTIRLDLDGTYQAIPSSGANASLKNEFEYALVVGDPTAVTGEGQSDPWSTSSQIYRVNNANAWRLSYEWDSLTPVYRLQGQGDDRYVEVDSTYIGADKDGNGVTDVVAKDASGTATHNKAYEGHSSYSLYSDKSGPYQDIGGGWTYANNPRWFWTGRVDMRNLGLYYGNQLRDTAHASYSMFCGNGFITNNTSHGAPPVPEPTSMVLLTLALGAGLRGARRLRKK